MAEKSPAGQSAARSPRQAQAVEQTYERPTFRDFADRFGLGYSSEQAQSWFFNWVRNNLAGPEFHQTPDSLARSLASHVGVRYQPISALERSFATMEKDSDPEFVRYLPGDWVSTLRALEFLHAALPALRGRIEAIVVEGLSSAPAALALRWSNGRFYPAGVPVLDQELVVEQQRWLREAGIEGAWLPFESALRGLVEGHDDPERLKGVVRDAYEAVEHLAKVAIGKDLDITANRERLVSKLRLPSSIADLLKGWISEGNPYRHGADLSGRPDFSPDRAEEYVYESALLLRAIVRRHAFWAEQEPSRV